MNIHQMYEADRERRKPGVLTSLMIAQLRDKFIEADGKFTRFEFAAPVDYETGQPVIVALSYFDWGLSSDYWSERTELWEPLPAPMAMRLTLGLLDFSTVERRIADYYGGWK